MKLPDFEIQTALYARLNDSIDCEIYDAVPQNWSYPYVEIGDPISVADSCKSNAFISTVQLHGWDNGRSKKRLLEIMSDCIETLTVSTDSPHTFLTLTNFTVHNQFYGGTTTLKDLDGKTWHSIMTIEIQVKQT